MEIKDLKTVFNKETKQFISGLIKQKKGAIGWKKKVMKDCQKDIETLEREIEILEAFVE